MIITDKAQIKCYELIESDLKLPADATFTRSSVAYLSDGTQVAANTPRFEQGKFGKAIMVEEGTENIHPNPLMNVDSNSDGIVDGFSYEPYNSSPSYSLDGGQKITMRAATASNAYAGVMTSTYIPVSAGATYTLSVEAKLVRSAAETVEFVLMWFDTNNAVIGAPGIYNQNPGTDYKRLSLTATAPANAVKAKVSLRLRASSTSDTGSAWFRRVQLEAKPYPTSFIDGTRAAETLTIPTTGVLSPQEGTVECWVYVNDVIKRVDGIPRRIFHLQRTADIDVALALYHSANFANWVLNINDAQQVNASDSLTPNGWNYFAVTFINGLAKLYINGVPAATITNAQLPIIGGDLWIGCRNDGTRQCNTLIDDLRISNRARTDEEILAAYQSGKPLLADEWTTYKLDFDDKVRITAQGQIICNEFIEI